MSMCENILPMDESCGLAFLLNINIKAVAKSVVLAALRHIMDRATEHGVLTQELQNVQVG